MSAILLQIADAVVEALNGHAFSRPFVAARWYVPKFTAEELADLKVSVIIGNPRYSPLTRGQRTGDFRVSVALQKALVAEQADQDADDMVGLIEEIVEYLNGRHMAGAAWVSTEALAVYDAGIMDKQGVFTSVYSFQYRL